MGYSGQKNWGDSDNACGLVYTIDELITQKLKFWVKKQDNEFNTPGCVDVALYMEAFVLPALNSPGWARVYDTEIGEIAEDAINRIEEIILDMNKHKEDWDSVYNYNKHVAEYQRMIKNLHKIASKLKNT